MNKKSLKKFFIYFSLSIFLGFFLSFLYIFLSQLPDSFDNRLRDYYFEIRGEIPDSDTVIIVDIDEKSLKELGQWPWSRNKVSQILKNLTDSGVGIIGFDIVFAEEDDSSPHRIVDKYQIKTNKELPNFDLELANTIANTPTILGYVFILEDNKHISKLSPNARTIFAERNKTQDYNFLLKAHGTVLNIPQIQNNSYSSGFFNNTPDDDSGIIRSVPLAISYDNTMYASLSLEILRIITQTKIVFLNYDDNGIKSIGLNNIDIPTDRQGRLLVNFRGPGKSFKYYSASDIFYNRIKKEELANKIVLIGASAAGLLDLRSIPLDFVFPGVEVHANAIDNILTGDFISKESWVDGANIAIIFLLSIMITLIITYTPIWANPLILVGFLAIVNYLLYTLLFDYGLVFNIFFPLVTIVISSIFATLLDYFYEIKQEEAIKRKFASKVSKEVMDKLLKNIDSNEFHAMEKEVTVFFSDVRGFTNISEKMHNAKNLIEYLNEYMEPMSNIITKYEGTIDKYIGDAIMAYWNAPGNVKNHADKAVQASLMQIKELEPLNKMYEINNKPYIDIGIGLNTGIAIVGEMGSKGRSDYTVIGDPINLGARLESLCKYYNSKLNISNFTKEQLREKYIFRFLDLVRVKGKKEPIEIWQVIDFGEAKGDLKEELYLYDKAIKLYKNSKFENALKLFEELENNKNKTNKNIYKIYCHRCEEYIKTPPVNFDGVYEHTTKG